MSSRLSSSGNTEEINLTTCLWTGRLQVDAPEPISSPTLARGLSRRAFLKWAAVTASSLALPASAAAEMIDALDDRRRLPVIWLSFQECTGCSESLTRAEAPTLERLLFGFISLEYHHLLQAAAGTRAEAARDEAREREKGGYLLVVEGSIPTALGGACATTAGKSHLDQLREFAADAAAVIAVGGCATDGGLPAAAPNPTGAMGVAALMEAGLVATRPLVNLPGCPPLPVVLSGTLAHYLAFGRFPDSDEAGRPRAFYGGTVHERCSRYHFYQQGLFARRFDDEGARQGWCLYELGCRGPVTRNACASHKWNGGVSFPIQAGHPCIGCSESGFWDRDGFYRPLEAIALERADASGRGEALYQGNCVYCHPVDPAQFGLAPEELVERLRASGIRAHRRFSFTDGELQDLEAYLSDRAATPP